MIVLTKLEMFAVSGGDMACFCTLDNIGMKLVRAKITKFNFDSDISRDSCEEACCIRMPGNVGWYYRGSDSYSWFKELPTGVMVQEGKEAIRDCSNH